ncbi:hypothetical protein CC86DRAFT_459045 [Ophiobolus disseminans]|uniref:DUF4188 domain-containing protein n=1 Tax=Ophiobolus disseminans TaxID=1469910 RepID=A0A6A6ZKU5_9PLEO|nr:hypothetical protein CC86DRAFT_459045 [Ophiobolus disseminans]
MSVFREIYHTMLPVDYTVSTWLTLGALLQCILVALLPRNVALLPPIAIFMVRFIRGYLIAKGALPNPVTKEVTHGRQTWQIPSADGTVATTGSRESIVVLVLSASFSHPNGRYSPGSKTMNDYFVAMWLDAQENREKYGYLGNTPALYTQDDGTRQDTKGSTAVYLSYWKSLEGLHRFAHAGPHMKGQLWWENGAMNNFPHLGVSHEVYEVPAGNWENVYHNFRPFGITNTEYPVPVINEESGKESVQWVSGLRSADGKDWKNMQSRMGRKAVFGATKPTRL